MKNGRAQPHISLKDFPPRMRCADEVQFAHDMLVAMLTGKAPMVVGKEGIPYVHAAADVLCWVLKHDHNKTFGKNLDGMKRALVVLGHRMRRGETSNGQ